MSQDRRLVQEKVMERGKIGEEEAKFQLNFLPPFGYALIHDVKVQSPINGDTAQIDHIAIGPNGIFLVETKNWSGKYRWKNGGDLLEKFDVETKEWVPWSNPIAQVHRHESVIEALLGHNGIACDIHSFIAYVERKGDYGRILNGFEGHNRYVKCISVTALPHNIRSSRAKHPLHHEQILAIKDLILQYSQKREHFEVHDPQQRAVPQNQTTKHKRWLLPVVGGAVLLSSILAGIVTFFSKNQSEPSQTTRTVVEEAAKTPAQQANSEQSNTSTKSDARTAWAQMKKEMASQLASLPTENMQSLHTQTQDFHDQWQQKVTSFRTQAGHDMELLGEIGNVSLQLARLNGANGQLGFTLSNNHPARDSSYQEVLRSIKNLAALIAPQ
jgi:hypothetical protein